MSARHPASGAKTQDSAHAQRGADARNLSCESNKRQHRFFSVENVSEFITFIILSIFFGIPVIFVGIIKMSN